VAAVKEGF